MSQSRSAFLSCYFGWLVPHIPVTERLWETSTVAPHAHLSRASLVVSQLDIVTQEVENEDQHFLIKCFCQGKLAGITWLTSHTAYLSQYNPKMLFLTIKEPHDAFFLLLIALSFMEESGGWRRGRRRHCPWKGCQVSSWSSWSACSATHCGTSGSQYRSRVITVIPSCSGASCPH